MKKITLPVSKSLFIRKLICNFLNEGCVGEIPAEAPADVKVVHEALMLVAGAVKNTPSGTEMPTGEESGVEPKNGVEDAAESRIDKSQTMESAERLKGEPVVIDVHDCGAAYRFLMAVLAVTPGQWLLTGTERLLQRPIEELVQCLRSVGADIQWISDDDNVISRGNVPRCASDDDNVNSCRDALQHVSTNVKSGCWLIRGKNLHASDLTIDCHRSGQFASALLLIGEKIGLKNLHILPENPPSLSYIEMTKAVVNGSVKLEAGHLADWSAAVYWYACLLLEGLMQRSNRSQLSSGTAFGDAPASYKLLHLDLNSIQSDAVIARWFADWGIESRQEEDGVVITYKENLIKSRKVIELDVSQNLDLVPVLACMACLWPKKMIFNGVENLKYKESNRLQIIQEQLSAFANIKVNMYRGVDDNQLVIDPCRDALQHVSTTNNGANSGKDARPCVSTICSNDPNCPGVDFVFDAHNDHRFVMGFSLFALCGKVRINDFDSVKKSYPNFHAEGVVGGTDMVG